MILEQFILDLSGNTRCFILAPSYVHFIKSVLELVQQHFREDNKYINIFDFHGVNLDSKICEICTNDIIDK